jgi:hypothetical protein
LHVDVKSEARRVEVGRYGGREGLNAGLLGS